MKISESIFKSYDVRGIFPSELDEQAAFEIGQVFVRNFNVKRIVIGQDARSSSPALFKVLAAGFSSAGAIVTDIGQVPTECVYFALANYNFDSGVMITASHNPKEYNGFKIIRKVDKNLEMVRGTELLLEMQKSAPGEKYVPAGPEDQPEYERLDMWNDFLKHILNLVDLVDVMPLKVAIDSSNGVAWSAISRMQDKLPIEIIPLNSQPDGNFPGHGPNPLFEGSANQIRKIIKEKQADFGVMFDGDADRIFLADEKGQMVSADITLLILAKYLLEKNPGMAIAYNAICSKAVPEFVAKWGGKPIRTQVGFVNVRDGLLKNGGIMGGELSGHYCFKDNFYMDSGMISLLIMLELFSKDQRKVSEIVAELSIYPKGAEINFKVEDKVATMEKVKEKYADGKQDYLDGVTVQYPDWWFNLRPSNTEPLLRLTVEADTKELLEKKQKELTKLIK